MSQNFTTNGCPFPDPFPFDPSVPLVPISASGRPEHRIVTAVIPSVLQNEYTEHGFHPWAQSRMGLTSPSRHYWEQFLLGPPIDSHVDWVPYSGRIKHDFCMRYVYDVPMVFYFPDMDEEVILPITEIVYRRDPFLLWDEITEYLQDGIHPDRYKHTGTGLMSASWFRFMCRRFYLHNRTLYEHSTQLEVVQASHDLETACLLLPWDIHHITPRELIQGIQDLPKGWYVDGLARAAWFLEYPTIYSTLHPSFH